MKITFKQAGEINKSLEHIYAKNPGLEKTKFDYAQKRFFEKNFSKIFNEYNQKLANIRINNALEDKTTGEILLDQMNPREFKYSKEGLIKCLNEEKELENEYNAKEIEVEPFISSFVPEVTTETEKELLTGLLI